MEGDEAKSGLNFTPMWSVSGSITPPSHNDKRERFTRDETKPEKGMMIQNAIHYLWVTTLRSGCILSWNGIFIALFVKSSKKYPTN